MSQAQISREEFEELLKEVRELRKAVEDLVVTLKPILYIVEKMPELMVDPGVFKAAAPILSIPYALERVNMNVLGATMVSGMECLSKSLEKLATMQEPPRFSLLSILRDKETREAIGVLMEILKSTVPCMQKGIKQMATP